AAVEGRGADLLGLRRDRVREPARLVQFAGVHLVPDLPLERSDLGSGWGRDGSPARFFRATVHLRTGQTLLAAQPQPPRCSFQTTLRCSWFSLARASSPPGTETCIRPCMTRS